MILSKAAGRRRLSGITVAKKCSGGDGDVAGWRDHHPGVKVIALWQ
ncbi:MAG: hypothetical protein ACREF3_11910 [Acetobacteraceae bacterium]